MIRYTDHITPEEYMELRKKVGWIEFPIEEVRACVENAYDTFDRMILYGIQEVKDGFASFINSVLCICRRHDRRSLVLEK